MSPLFFLKRRPARYHDSIDGHERHGTNIDQLPKRGRYILLSPKGFRYARRQIFNRLAASQSSQRDNLDRQGHQKIPPAINANKASSTRGGDTQSASHIASDWRFAYQSNTHYNRRRNTCGNLPHSPRRPHRTRDKGRRSGARQNWRPSRLRWYARRCRHSISRREFP